MTRTGRRVLSSVAAVCASALLGLAGVGGTWAAFTDTGSAGSGTFSATTLVAPTGVTCNAGVLGTGSVSWTAPAGPVPQGYRITYVSTYGVSGTVTLGAGVTSWKPTSGMLGIDVPYTVTVQSSFGSNWVSATSSTVSIRVTGLIIFFNLYLRCA